MVTFQRLGLLLNKRDKKLLVLLVVFSIYISIMETVGISAIVPLISAANDPNFIEKNRYMAVVYRFFSFDSSVQFILYYGMAIIAFYLIRIFSNTLYFYSLGRFTYHKYYGISGDIFEKYIRLSYRDFASHNSSVLTKVIVQDCLSLASLISSSLFFFSELLITLVLYGLVLFVNWRATVYITVILVCVIFILTKTVTKKIKKIGKDIVEWQRAFFKTIASSFGNFKMIKLCSNENVVFSEFNDINYAYSNAFVTSYTLQNLPRLILETVGFGLVACVIVILVYRHNEIRKSIPVISMYILVLYRLLPSFNRILSSYNQVIFNWKALDVIVENISYRDESLGNKSIEFRERILLEKISFGYDREKVILEDVSLEIRKGEKIGFIGESGVGKSTLVDIICGLYKPASGEIVIDDERLCEENVRCWRRKFGYIPQEVFLFEGSVAENVVFGREYDERKVIDVLVQAEMYNFLKERDGIHTSVGEKGVRLSGGQKQRIAIARGLYGDPEVIIFDEGTSALDKETEAKVMEKVLSVCKDKTVIIIGHRVNTVQHCDRLYRVEEKMMNEVSLKNGAAGLVV